jgi:subtilisin family serine protease
MQRRFAAVLLLALANLSVFAVAEAASGVERAAPAPAGPVVAVLDTGVAHGLGVMPGVDLVAGDADAADENGHGTAVAARIRDACTGCRILPVRVLSSRGSAPWSRVAAGIVWAVDRGARVLNVSISGDGGSAALREAVAYATARDVLVVASAGNAGDERPQYPAAYSAVVGVSASDGAGQLYDWSSRGRWVDLAVPGCSRLPAPSGGRAWACGTSFAAPLAAGVAALARSADPAAPAAAITARLPGLVRVARAPRASLRITGRPLAGATLRAATAPGLVRGLGEHVRWFRCRPAGSPYACVLVATGSAYRVQRADAGWVLVARVVTQPFGGLWLAASPRLPVAS